MYYDNNQQYYGGKRTSQVKNRNSQQKAVRTPRVDLFETASQYYLRLSLPGVKKEHLEVFVNEGGILELKGKVVTKIPEHVRNIIIQEIYQGPFHRQVKLPKTIDKQSVKFDYNSGILEIYINKE